MAETRDGEAHSRIEPDGIGVCLGLHPRRAYQAESGLEHRPANAVLGDHLTKTRVGRRNRYQINGETKVRLPRLPAMTIGQLLLLLQQALEQQPFT
jgi:hypothetical protein